MHHEGKRMALFQEVPGHAMAHEAQSDEAYFFHLEICSPTATTSACAKQIGPASMPNGFELFSSIWKHTLACGASGESAWSVMAITGTLRAWQVCAIAITSGV